MAAKIIPVPSFDMVVFGATGDLTRRKLLPALYYRFRDGQIPEDSWIIGAARSELSRDEFRQHAEEAIAQHVPEGDRDAETVARFCARLDYVAIDASSDQGWDALRALPRGIGGARPRLLSRDLARTLRSGVAAAEGARTGHAALARRAREADRP